MENNTSDIITLLSFRLGKEIYAIPVEKALEVLDNRKITKVPKTDEYLLGVINLRGDILPVVDLRRRYNMLAHEDTVDTKIVILDLMQNQRKQTMGILVDAVIEVFEVSYHQVENVPELGNKYAHLLSGMVKWRKDYILLLNLDQIFMKEEEKYNVIN